MRDRSSLTDFPIEIPGLNPNPDERALYPGQIAEPIVLRPVVVHEGW